MCVHAPPRNANGIPKVTLIPSKTVLSCINGDADATQSTTATAIMKVKLNCFITNQFFVANCSQICVAIDVTTTFVRSYRFIFEPPACLSYRPAVPGTAVFATVLPRGCVV
jgi:hypothetical protein